MVPVIPIRMHMLRRVFVKTGGQISQRDTGIGHLDHDRIYILRFGHISRVNGLSGLLLNHDRSGTLLQRLVDVIVTVSGLALDGNEQSSRLNILGPVMN